MRHLAWIIPLALVGTLAAAVFRPRGVTVVLTNGGATPMRDVWVDVTGGSYPVGALEPGASGTVRVNPTGESHLVLRYADGDRAAQAVEVGCYFERGYSGRISVDVAGGKAMRVNDQIRLPRW